MKQNSVVARQAGNHHQDLGSNPRSSQFLFDFVLQVIKCTSKHTAYHAPSSIQQPDGLKAKSDGQALKVYVEPSQHMHMESKKSNEARSKWASGLLITPLKQTQTPLLSPIYFLFYLISNQSQNSFFK